MGKIVNNYELLEQLGQGGMGVVYKARHIHFDEIYAVKRLWEQFGANEMVLNLFLNEAKILRKLNHKNIVHVTDVFRLENQNYIVMEYIKGRSLDEVIKKEVGPIRRERAINLFKQMLEGIAYIHSQPTPIIHRDIKPLNLLVTEDDTVKITDFGIAKALDAGQNASTVVKGTPVYMSPEQIIDPKSVDIRTDVYSLGMTFYEMLCGKTPFAGDTTTTPTAVYATIMNGEVPPPTHFYPGISDALSHFVMKAIHKDRYQRFTDANEMLRELEKLENSGATTFQEGPKFVQPVVNKAVPEQSTFAEPKKPESNEKLVPKYVIKPQSKESNNIWKWVAGFVIVAVGLILGIKSLEFGKKRETPATDTTKVGIPESNLTSEVPEGMVLVEGGTFNMGSNDRKSELVSKHKPVHSVTLGSFFLGKTEVTQELWKSVMGINPSEFKGDKRPVETVTWNDVVEFCNKLSEKEGLQKAYSGSGESITCNFTANGYRLPTEAEWEYAARGGKQSKGYKYSGSDNLGEVGWYGAFNNSGNRTEAEGTSEVGKKQPNELGIYDMSGNVWEWCWDWFGDYTPDAQTNPRGANTDPFLGGRVLRGGCWRSFAEYFPVAYRHYFFPDDGYYGDGFRLARTK